MILYRAYLQVSAYPVFPGKEAEYLRAQIARIAASTVVCPAGAFQASEEGAPEKVEGFAAPPASELASAESWTHRSAHLKKQGTPHCPWVHIFAHRCQDI